MRAISGKPATDRDIIGEYTRVRAFTESLCEPLETEDYVPQLSVDVSPVKWNIAHTSWFFEELILKKNLAGYREFDKNYSFLFNSYYNTVGQRTLRNKRGDLSRPTVREIFEYRAHVNEAMLNLLSDCSDEDVIKLVTLGINHEQQHQELLLTDLKYTLSLNPLAPVYRDDFALVEKGGLPIEGFVGVAGGDYEIGFGGPGFCFDNELGRHTVRLDDYEISQTLVTNGEYFEFILDGGYEDFRLWHSDGWDWINKENRNAPLYWELRDGEWFQFTLAGRRRCKPDAPLAHVSFYEAAAYSAWQGMRLPTEFEWETASERFEWGLRWEWTNSSYLPYPGFRVAEGAVGEYNGKFMVNQMVLRGGSVATPEGHSRKTYRNFFHPHLSWQFTGIRLAK